MKQRIDLKKAAEAEVFGALAVGGGLKRGSVGAIGRRFTPAQNRALSDLARSLVKVAREAGAEHGRITIGNISFELQENGSEEILSIRTGVAS